MAALMIKAFFYNEDGGKKANKTYIPFAS